MRNGICWSGGLTHTVGVNRLLSIKYQGKELDINHEAVYKAFGFPLPTDQKRNMMNASSNFDIIYSANSSGQCNSG